MPQYPNITQDGKYALRKVVTEIGIRDVNWDGTIGWLHYLIEKGSVKIDAKPRFAELLDNSKEQLGYDFSFEIVSHQFYTMHEFERLMNKNVTLNLGSMNTYIHNVKLNIEVMAEPNSEKGTVKLTGSKFVSKLIEVISPDPYGGSFPEPWAQPSTTPGGPPKESIPQGADPTYNYESVLRTDDPYIEFISPSTPTPSSDIIELKIVVASPADHEPVLSEPKDVAFEEFNGSSWVTINPTDYDIVYEGGIYKVHYTVVSTGFTLGDRVRVRFNLD